MLGLGAWEWNASKISASQGRESLRQVVGADKLLSSVVWRFSPAPLSFAEKFSAFIEGPGSSFVLNAPVTDINVRERKARSLEVTLLSGRKHVVEFDTLILAAGGLENIRLLLEMQSRLLSRGQQADRSGWLGRGWQEHPHVPIGTAFIPDSIADGPLWLHTDRREIDGIRVIAGFSFPRAVLERQRMGAVSVTIPYSRFSPDGVPYAAGLRRVTEAVSGEPTQARVLYARTESRVVRKSRVSLSGVTDPLGRQQIKLDWRLADDDYRDLALAAGLISQAFAQLNLGVVRADTGQETLAQRMGGGAHHMGGARMSADPREGVTDEYGALHQIPNIFVTGSATFPSSGFSNPTLTLMSLALRQANHIVARTPE